MTSYGAVKPPVKYDIVLRMVQTVIFGIAAIAAGYLLGSFPTAYIITRLRKGKDIRDVDVGNVGAGSVFRQVGFVEGLIVTVVDIAKGSGSILIAQAMGLHLYWVMGAGFAAVLGHCFPVYIGFRGGQGIATMIGIFLVLVPWAAFAVLVLIGIALLLIRHLFAAIFVSGPLLPVFIWIFYGSTEFIVYSLVIIVFVVLKTMRRWKEVPKKVGDKQKPGLLAIIKSLLKR
jgi:glycerol-3-phosphate acyltransferase PlsY